jgi:hypothetical protein
MCTTFVHKVPRLCLYKNALEHHFTEPNIHLSRDINSVSELHGQKGCI